MRHSHQASKNHIQNSHNSATITPEEFAFSCIIPTNRHKKVG